MFEFSTLHQTTRGYEQVPVVKFLLATDAAESILSGVKLVFIGLHLWNVMPHPFSFLKQIILWKCIRAR